MPVCHWLGSLPRRSLTTPSASSAPCGSTRWIAADELQGEHDLIDCLGRVDRLGALGQRHHDLVGVM